MPNYRCSECKLNYNNLEENLYKCSRCQSWLDKLSQDGIDNGTSVRPQALEVKLADIFESQAELWEATNRATHAVRSIATLIVISLASSIAGGLFYLLGLRIAVSCRVGDSDCGSQYMTDVGLTITVLGFFTALAVSIFELHKSHV